MFQMLIKLNSLNNTTNLGLLVCLKIVRKYFQYVVRPQLRFIDLFLAGLRSLSLQNRTVLVPLKAFKPTADLHFLANVSAHAGFLKTGTKSMSFHETATETYLPPLPVLSQVILDRPFQFIAPQTFTIAGGGCKLWSSAPGTHFSQRKCISGPCPLSTD